MPYSNRIRTLEESYNIVESQIKALEQSENPDKDKLNKLWETKNKYLNELREMRRAQYEESQTINYDEDR